MVAFVRGCLVLIFLALATSIGGCSQTFQLQVVEIEKVEAYPEQRHEFNLPHEWPRSAEGSRFGFVRIKFESEADIESQASTQGIVYVRYELYPCRHAGPHVQTGDIFPVSGNADRHVYEAYVPASFQALQVEGSGAISRGWPASIAEAGLCFRVRGQNMAGQGLESAEARVDDMLQLMQ